LQLPTSIQAMLSASHAIAGLALAYLGMLVICKHAIANCICDRTFCQKLHIAHFSTIAYVKIMLHMLHFKKFAYIRTYAAYFCICNRIFSAFFLPNYVLKLLNIFGGKRLPVLTIRG